ncbi:hypothetical protein GQ44DRAFT_779717 [Phaeosphaeriaceae sp. PMI808]|nr:hypothetical protein GQ44DRAFT_779717 [Phaeosphaeriaceae sp. PMI808]
MGIDKEANGRKTTLQLLINPPTATMKRNIVIFLIILILFILIALIGYIIYYLQTRMAVAGTASSVSDMTEG